MPGRAGMRVQLDSRYPTPHHSRTSAPITAVRFVSTQTHDTPVRKLRVAAWSWLGKDGYHWLANNCEHFCNWAIDGVHESGQVERGSVAAGSGLSGVMGIAGPAAVAGIGGAAGLSGGAATMKGLATVGALAGGTGGGIATAGLLAEQPRQRSSIRHCSLRTRTILGKRLMRAKPDGQQQRWRSRSERWLRSWLLGRPVHQGQSGAPLSLVPLHRDFDWLIFGHFRMGRFSGATSSSMLRATPGWRRIKPARSMVRTIW